jgi:hypothetical protein
MTRREALIGTALGIAITAGILLGAAFYVAAGGH